MATTRSLPDRPLLRRHHRPWPMEGEVRDLVISQGEIPPDLDGTLFRIGPNARYAPLSGCYNGWMGDGMVHALTFTDGKAHYRNRWVRTPKWQAEDRAGRAVFDYVLPSKKLLAIGMEVTRPTPESAGAAQGSCNTSLTNHGEYLVAWGEGQSTPTAVDPQSLETIGPPRWTTQLPASMTEKVDEFGFGGGHPRVCPVTGEVLFTTIHVEAPYVTVHIWNPRDDELRSIALDAPYSSYIHDFMITQSHAIVIVSPITMSQERVLKGGGLMAWEPDRGTHIAVVSRVGAKTVWIDADRNFYDLHPQNAFVDHDGTVVLDAPEFPIAPVPMDGVDPWKQFAGLESHLVRYRIDPTTATMTSTALDDRNIELPQCDLRQQGLPYRYGYNLCNDGELDDYNFNAVLRYDLDTNATTVHRFGGHDSLSEPLFIPRTADATEGDGYLFVYVFHPEEDRSDAVLLDATDLRREPIATIALPHRVPFTAHGCWAAA
jgi:carotenoid cleavage dioxygenase-like enzyme